MEEEIITPEEEVFAYNKLRYILNNEGYVCHASLGGLIICDLGECTEYNGEIPSGYSTIEEWYDSEIDKLNAWKIVSGNLVYDENRYNEIQKRCEIEEEENTPSTHKWVRNQLKQSNSVVIDEFSNNVSGTSLLILENSGDYEIPKVTVSSETVTSCNILASNKNLLGIDAVTQTVNGITFTINEDGTIKLNGTSTSKIEMTLKGTSTNTDMLFLIQENLDYVLSGLVTGISLNLYNYDGSDRSLIGTYKNGVFNLSNSNTVTLVTLSIASGKTFEDVVISPQIELSSEATTFIKHQETKDTLTLTNKEATTDRLCSYNPLTILMVDKEVNVSVDYFKYKSLEEQFGEIEVTEETIKSQVQTTTEKLNELGEYVGTIEKTILEQTNKSFTMWFEETGLQNDMNAVKDALEGNTDSLNTITEYIHFEGAEITLGKSDSQTKLVIKNNRISFMTGDTESAYISENTLYITDSTILNKMQIGHWETKEDDYNNLNTKWVGDN